MSEVLYSLTHAVPAGYMLAEIALGALAVAVARRRQRADFLAACLQLTLEVNEAIDNYEQGNCNAG